MSGSEIALSLDKRVYSIEAAQKAAYRFSDVFAPAISIDGDTIACVLSTSKDLSPADIEHYKSRFLRELLDQELRIKIKRETEAVRNLILGVAFSKTDLLDNE